jgi:hypothetical protein
MQTAIRTAITKAVTQIEEETREARTEPLSGNEFLEALFAKLFPEAPAKKTRAKKEAPATPAKKKEEAVTVPVTPETETKTVVLEAPGAPKKAGRPKKEKGPENLAKLTPTQTKKFKEHAGEDGDKKAFLAYVNGMTAEEYNAKKLEEHMVAFAKPKEEEEEIERERDCIPVKFEGKTYYVSPEDKKVYAEGDDGVHVFKGYAGMAAFKGMEVPE